MQLKRLEIPDIREPSVLYDLLVDEKIDRGTCNEYVSPKMRKSTFLALEISSANNFFIKTSNNINFILTYLINNYF